MFRYANWRVHGIIETLGKSGANPENEEYDTHPPLINQQELEIRNYYQYHPNTRGS